MCGAICSAVYSTVCSTDQAFSQNGSPVPLTLKLRSGNSKVDFELKLRDSKFNFQIQIRIFHETFGLFKVSFIFQVRCPQLVYKTNHKVCEKMVSRKIKKIV